MFGFGRKTLYTRVYSDAILTEAWRKVKGGTEAAGVDDVTTAQFETQLFANLKSLQEELRQQRYYPQPVKRIYMEKTDGTRRPLGILTVRDRIVQRAVLEVIDPLFDRNFAECSHGFRRGRSIHTALAHVTRLVEQQHGWLVDLDIAAFFENIHLRTLFKLLKATIAETALRHMLRAWLEVETVVVERTGMQRREKARGLLQGGVLSPLFANVYLDRFDQLALKRGLQLVRYGDDIIVCCCTKAEAEAALKLIEKFLAKLHLTVNPHKTMIVHAEKGFRFLGEHLFLQTQQNGAQRLAGWRAETSERPTPALLPAMTSPAVPALPPSTTPPAVDVTVHSDSEEKVVLQ